MREGDTWRRHIHDHILDQLFAFHQLRDCRDLAMIRLRQTIERNRAVLAECGVVYPPRPEVAL